MINPKQRGNFCLQRECPHWHQHTPYASYFGAQASEILLMFRLGVRLVERRPTMGAHFPDWINL